jgi:hypothetical protein
MTAADLNDDYVGWYLRVETGDPVARWHHLELKVVRSHELAGNRCALVGKDHGGRFAGVEYHFSNAAAVVLEKPITAKAKRMAKALADA